MVQTAPQSLLALLDEASCHYELIQHTHTENALAEAEAVGVDPFHVAKTIVLTTPDGFVRAVVPASERLDIHKARELLETNQVTLATEEALAGAYPEFDVGAVPPFGGSHDDHVVVDGRLCGSQFVIVEAGTHEESLRLKTADLIGLTDALLGDLCEDRPL
jgi:Ala-tRNA(Pro) deacylase